MSIAKPLKHKNIETQEHKNLIIKVFGFCIALLLYCSITLFLFPDRTLAADFNQNSLISDGSFVAVDDMSENDIQAFLESKGSLLKDFSENGRRASKIIYDAAHGHGDASGSAYGIDIQETVSPKVLLVTIQKEEGLLEGYYSDPAHYSQIRLDWAMGYGYTESTIYDEYKGFTKQIENGAWQLRYNYERAQGHGFGDYQVGQEFCFDDDCGRFDNRATASLYRYTPHVYNGNYNFWFYYNKWFIQKPYDSEWVSQNGYPSLFTGTSYQFEVTFRNTGTETWQKGTVFLGTDHSRDHVPWMVREGDGPSGWFSGNRIWLVENSVAPGDTGTFRFWLRIPTWASAGDYKEYFTPVADGYNWMRDQEVHWNVRVRSESEKYSSAWVSQNVYPTLSPGQSYNFVVNIKNTGSATWHKGTVNLGTSKPLDRTSGFIRADINNLYGHPSNWLSPNRIYMQQDNVAPDETATFSFWMSVPNSISEGTYREYFRLVADGISWMEDHGIYWDVNVAHPHAEWVNQSNYPTLRPGEKAVTWIEYKNTGQVAWIKGSVNLGTDRSRDRESLFYYSDWLSRNRISLDQSTISPGETGRFTFFINAPQNTAQGVYREYFRPVFDQVSWLEDFGVYLDVTIY